MLNLSSEKIAKLLPNKLVTTNGKKGDKTLYLTFDDGPHPIYTMRLCELLDKYSAKASFFCIGYNLEQHSSVYVVRAYGTIKANFQETLFCP